MGKKITLWITGIILVLQVFQINKTNPQTTQEADFITIHQPPEHLSDMIRTSCYDCHSYQTSYPWYTYTQPMGWWIQRHIDEGRDELNFSEWTDYSPERADHKLEEAAEYVLNEEMPLPSFLIAHADARLSEEQRKELAGWFEEQRTLISKEDTEHTESGD